MENCYIAIGAIVKNEGRYIQEWIEYHRLIGVEKFYIVDNGSTDDTLSVLSQYIKMGIAEVYQLEGKDMQLYAYNILINKHKDDTKWIGFIDVDEYIYIHDGSDIKDFLKDYEEYNGLGINWRCIGPTGHKYAVKGSVIANYTQMLDLEYKENLHIKSIVQPKKVKMYNFQPHAAIYLDGKPCVDENCNPIYGNEKMASQEFVKIAFTMKHSSEKIALLHYNSKSEEESYYRSMKGKALGKWDNYNVFLRFMSLYSDNYTFEFDGMKKYVTLIEEKIDSEKIMDSVVNEGIQENRVDRNCEDMMIIQNSITVNLSKHPKILIEEEKEEICAECQEMAIAIGNLVEQLVGEGSNTVRYLEIYCELLYKICEENVVTNQHVELINNILMKAGYSIIK